jgi:site-specific recombinase XerD
MTSQPKSHASLKNRPKTQAKSSRLFTLEEINHVKLWASASIARGEREGALLTALFGTAGRRFEVAALRVQDVHLGPGGPEVYFPETKGGKSATIPITGETFTALLQWIKREHHLEGHVRNANEPLIPTQNGEFMHPATLWRLFGIAIKKAGITRQLGVHATRHAAGFLLLRATGDLTKVQEFLRHSSLATTAAWYRHVHMPDLRAGIAKAGL